MSLKDKIAIGLIIIFVVLLGFMINGIAVSASQEVNIISDENGDGGKTISDLAYVAARYQNTFLGYSVSSLHNKYLELDYTGRKQTIAYKSGMCMYHQNGTTNSSYNDSGKAWYKIYNVIDFDYNSADGIMQIKNNRI